MVLKVALGAAVAILAVAIFAIGARVPPSLPGRRR